MRNQFRRKEQVLITAEGDLLYGHTEPMESQPSVAPDDHVFPQEAFLTPALEEPADYTGMDGVEFPREVLDDGFYQRVADRHDRDVASGAHEAFAQRLIARWRELR